MAAAYISTTWIEASSADGSASIAIPPGATLGMPFWCGWANGGLTLNGITVDGQAVNWLVGPLGAAPSSNGNAGGAVTRI